MPFCRFYCTSAHIVKTQTTEVISTFKARISILLDGSEGFQSILESCQSCPIFLSFHLIIFLDNGIHIQNNINNSLYTSADLSDDRNIFIIFGRQ